MAMAIESTRATVEEAAKAAAATFVQWFGVPLVITPADLSAADDADTSASYTWLCLAWAQDSEIAEVWGAPEWELYRATMAAESVRLCDEGAL